MSEEYSVSERISFALQWLGFEQVEIGKRFSVKKFTDGEKKVIEPEIRYCGTDGLIFEPIAGDLVKVLEGILDFHEKADTFKEKIQEKTKKAGY